MRRAAVVFVTGVTVATAAVIAALLAAAGAAKPSGAGTALVVADKAELHAEANAYSGTVGTLALGDTVRIDERTVDKTNTRQRGDGWYKVRAGGKQGWLPAVDLVEDASGRIVVAEFAGRILFRKPGGEIAKVLAYRSRLSPGFGKGDPSVPVSVEDASQAGGAIAEIRQWYGPPYDLASADSATRSGVCRYYDVDGKLVLETPGSATYQVSTNLSLLIVYGGYQRPGWRTFNRSLDLYTLAGAKRGSTWHGNYGWQRLEYKIDASGRYLAWFLDFALLLVDLETMQTYRHHLAALAGPGAAFLACRWEHRRLTVEYRKADGKTAEPLGFPLGELIKPAAAPAGGPRSIRETAIE